MRDSTKNTLRQIAFFLGVVLSGIGVILLVFGLFQINLHVKRDQEPFDLPVSLSGTEARTEFTATATVNYNLSLALPVSSRTIASWDKCPETAHPDPGDVCPSTNQLKTEWSIADADDSQWHDWERYAPVEVDSSGYGHVGWFHPQKWHRYIVTARVMSGDPDLQGRTARARADLADKGDQMSVGFGNLWAALILMAALPFLAIGIPLILIGRRRKRHAAGEPGAA